MRSLKVFEMPSVLSTKRLDESSKNHLLLAGLGVVEYDAIQIELKPPSLETTPPYTALLFTSKNGFRSFIQALEKLDSPARMQWILPVYCVGESTAELIQMQGFPIAQCYTNASSMARDLPGMETGPFAYFCGNLRQKLLPESLEEKGLSFKEYLSYQTVLTPKRFQRSFEAILFYSPSGVQSHLSRNSLSEALPFCIGPTTAKEISKHTKRYIVADKPSITNLLLKTIRYFKSASPEN